MNARFARAGFVALFAAAGLCAAGAARAADWRSDAAGSSLGFVATFEGNAVAGTFRQFDVRLRLDASGAAPGSLDVLVTVTSADMKIADVNREIRGKPWFDYAGFPAAEFHSTDVHRVQGDAFVAKGTLLLKGVRQPVEVPFTWNESGNGATLQGELTLQRGAFGIGTGEWAAADVIGADVKVRYAVRLVRAG